MMQTEDFLKVIGEIAGRTDIVMESSIAELGLDSTHVVEMLIELEIMHNVDLLHADMNLDELHVLWDIFDYVQKALGTEPNRKD
ncbi:hypothetical protein [Paenibacillus kobensis]|uniref:hypothetical protein n=1 Tax=Paenibacillus kobensis TaxID=59841 RepID=UPI000FD77397|nr:hypothetical protein [Paenibacillus kobensis]